MKMNFRKTFYLVTLSALALVAVMGLLLVPGVNTSGTASAQENAAAGRGEVATPEMIAYALTHSESAKDRFNYINQLPCQELSGDLNGKTLTAGVYCLPSANLASDLTLDGQGDTASKFIFRVAGGINVKGGNIALINDARAAGVVFAAESAEIGGGAEFRGNILTRKSIKVEDGSVLRGATSSLEGEVVASENAIAGAGSGTIEICKAIDPSTVDISNRIFGFTVTGVAGVIEVPVGSCSSPIDVPVPVGGSVRITELGGGRTLTGGTFSGNFSLVRVETLSANSPSTVGTVNLPARTVDVNLVEGGIPQQLTLRFVNRFSITGFVEICKAAATGPGTANPTGDPDVTGFFNFTIENVFQAQAQNPTSTALQVFTAPVGGCTGPIAVTIFDPSPTTTTNPRESTVRVTELGRTGFFLESVDTVPVDREVGTEVLGFGVNAQRQVVANPGGGYATVRVLEGGPAIETVVNFRNRSNPGQFKVCKIAGPGIPENTLFRFTVRGFGATTNAAPQFAVNGNVERIVDVRAGFSTPTSPAGTCALVPGFGSGIDRAEFQTFVNGTAVTVIENGISPLNTIPQNPGQLRTSRIRTSSAFIPASTGTNQTNFTPNPDLTPTADFVSRASTVQRAAFTEIEFTNFRFNPTLLKVCKIGTGTIDTTDTDGDPADSFTFDVALVPPTSADGVALQPAFTVPVTVTAGPAGPNGGFCTFVNGAGLQGGSFNQGSTITITERALGTGQTLTSITSSTSAPTPAAALPVGGLNVDLAARRATLLGTNGLVAGTTIVTFQNNGTADEGIGAGAVPFDFDGDRKADLSIYRGGQWWYAASSANGEQRATTFGLASDKTVPADFDGDGKNDTAVYRPSNGVWYILGTTAGFSAIQFGAPGDIPQAGDFDGDRKADVAVFRPSNGVWYMFGSRDGFSAVQFGQNGDIPVAADYDGDKRMDQAVYRGGTWFLLRSTAGFAAPGFGLATDVPVPADYDGDGKADTAVYRGGTWYMMRSTEGFRSVQLGISTDQPVPADYDGDNKADAAVYRSGVWYMIRSGQTGEAESIQFGNSTDVPVPASYLSR